MISSNGPLTAAVYVTNELIRRKTKKAPIEVKKSSTPNTEFIISHQGTEIKSSSSIGALRLLARIGADLGEHQLSSLYGENIHERSLIDSWISIAAQEETCLTEEHWKQLDQLLTTNNFIVSYQLTVADIALYCVISDDEIICRQQ